MLNFTRKPRYDYNDLLEIVRLLRSAEGCPWDRVQTHQSIRRGLLEGHTRRRRPSTRRIPRCSGRSWATC